MGVGFGTHIKVVFYLTAVSENVILATQSIIRVIDLQLFGVTLAQIESCSWFGTEEMLYAIGLSANEVNPRALKPGEKYIRDVFGTKEVYTITSGEDYLLESVDQFDWHPLTAPFAGGSLIDSSHYLLSRSFVYRRSSQRIAVTEPKYSENVKFHYTPEGCFVESNNAEMQELRLFYRFLYNDDRELASINTNVLWIHALCESFPDPIDWAHWHGVTGGALIQCYPEDSHYGGANVFYPPAGFPLPESHSGETSSGTWYYYYLWVPCFHRQLEYFGAGEASGVGVAFPFRPVLQKGVFDGLLKQLRVNLRLSSASKVPERFDSWGHFDYTKGVFL